MRFDTYDTHIGQLGRDQCVTSNVRSDINKSAFAAAEHKSQQTHVVVVILAHGIDQRADSRGLIHVEPGKSRSALLRCQWRCRHNPGSVPTLSECAICKSVLRNWRTVRAELLCLHDVVLVTAHGPHHRGDAERGGTQNHAGGGACDSPPADESEGG
jgi:hypothetical protein